jgi:MFS family permease
MFLAAPAFKAAGLPQVRHEMIASICGILVLGAAMAFIQVTSVATMVDSAKALDKRLVPAAGSFANFGMSLGGFIGPAAGSHLAEQLGFQDSFFVLSVTCVAASAAFLICVVAERGEGGERQSRKRLDRPINRSEQGTEGVDDISTRASDVFAASDDQR